MSTQKPWQFIISLILAFGLLVIFGYIAWRVALTANQAPRLSDVVPTTPPSLAPGSKDYPAQYRGGFDENARLLTLLAIVSPLLTTIVGFYFGQHAGQASARATQAQASQREAQIVRIARENPDKTAKQFVDDLKTHGVIGIPL